MEHCIAEELFQQYIVDMYAKIEQNRLNFFKVNQSTIRTELYQGIQDVLNATYANINASNVDKKIKLPSFFIGGPRYMNQLYQDAMSIIKSYGKPDLFITFTFNPKWTEITSSLLKNQAASDRPDLCARVFNNKVKALQYDSFHGKGKLISHIHVIKFQKRGHMHICYLY
jgi:helitron helicase-like protein